jgi:hypothetical protein
MSETNIFINKKINDIEIKMLRENEKCFIKIEPIKKKSNPKKIIIIINGEEHQWDVYDKNGRESHKIYLKGKQITPFFYLKDHNERYLIICNIDDINLLKISEEHNIRNFLRNKYNNISHNASCWAISIYKTSRKEKYPFYYM